MPPYTTRLASMLEPVTQSPNLLRTVATMAGGKQTQHQCNAGGRRTGTDLHTTL